MGGSRVTLIGLIGMAAGHWIRMSWRQWLLQSRGQQQRCTGSTLMEMDQSVERSLWLQAGSRVTLIGLIGMAAGHWIRMSWRQWLLTFSRLWPALQTTLPSASL